MVIFRCLLRDVICQLIYQITKSYGIAWHDVTSNNSIFWLRNDVFQQLYSSIQFSSFSLVIWYLWSTFFTTMVFRFLLLILNYGFFFHFFIVYFFFCLTFMVSFSLISNQFYNYLFNFVLFIFLIFCFLFSIFLPFLYNINPFFSFWLTI